MGNLTNALIIVMAINAVLFMGKVSIMEINPTNTGYHYDCNGNVLSQFERNGCNNATSYGLINVNNNSISSQLPSNPTIIDSIGQFFTDIYSSVRNWLLDSLGLSYVLAVLTAPSDFLSMTGLPESFVWVISAFWYGITLFLIVNWFKGGGE